MDSHIKEFSDGTITQISKLIGDYMYTGSQISDLFATCKLIDDSGVSTKWRRIDAVLKKTQKETCSPNTILRFIKEAFSPVRFIDKKEEFETNKAKMNQILAFSGIEVGNDGEIRQVTVSTTIDNAQSRTRLLYQKLYDRGAHSNVLSCCRSELLTENYFHAVFEASKSLVTRVKEMSGLSLDGSKLFDAAFNLDNPYIEFNRLSNASERNQQMGLKEMLYGMTQMVRNVTSHELKIKWTINEKDAVDILMTISFLHNCLDQCVQVPRNA